jgi:hypothetical protein
MTGGAGWVWGTLAMASIILGAFFKGNYLDLDAIFGLLL